MRRAQVFRLITVLLLLIIPLYSTAADWPTYLHDPQRSASQDETALSPANAGQLVNLWIYKTGGAVAASPTVVNNIIYIGSWDGYEYALDAVTGTRKWRTFLGTTTGRISCYPQHVGVSSTAAVQDGVVYVGGGDAYWYALNAATGAILWKVYTGDNSASGGHYNWSSPLIYNGYAYVGVSSLGDCPLVRGQLLKVSLSSHKIVKTFDTVSTWHSGGSIWGSPTLDAAMNTIYFSTGNEGLGPSPTQPYAYAVVALDATTLTPRGSWQVSRQDVVGTPDADWGSTPTLFDVGGRPLLAEVNKNGVVYAFDRRHISAGPVWRRRIAPVGGCVECGAGGIAPGCFNQHTLYVAGGKATVTGTRVGGSVQALDPRSGAVRWIHGTQSGVLAALACVNGLVIEGAGQTLEVLDDTTGAPLYSYPVESNVYGAASVSNGRIFADSTDGSVYAFGLYPEQRHFQSLPLSSYVNNVGISVDAHTRAGRLDAYSNSLSAPALQAAGFRSGGTIEYHGVPFQWPIYAAGMPDNILANGQTITLTSPLHAVKFAFLGVGTMGPAVGSGTITYSDGTSHSYELGLSDWVSPEARARPLYRNRRVVTMPYRNAPYGRSAIPASIFYAQVPVEATKVVTQITLPTVDKPGQMHIFAITLTS